MEWTAVVRVRDSAFVITGIDAKTVTVGVVVVIIFDKGIATMRVAKKKKAVYAISGQ